VVECTSLAQNSGTTADGHTFAEASAAALDRLTTERWGCAIDIGSLRPPYGAITPFDCPLDGPVRRAYRAAEELAERKHCRHVETIFLLYGCLVADGSVTKWLLKEADLEKDALQGRITRMIKPGTASSPPRPTRSCRHCRQEAQRYAAAAGWSMVREEHLLWALLMRGPDSNQFRTICRRLGLETGALAALMARRFPLPDSSQGSGESVSTL